MNDTSTAAAGKATLCMALVLASLAPGAAHPQKDAFAKVHERTHALRRATVTGCSDDQSTTDGSNYFVGIPGADNFADADVAASLGGDDNEVCAPNSLIAAGSGGLIELEPSVQDAFIGGGLDNVLSGTVSFLGAGDTNVVSGDHAFLGGGDLNEAQGQGTFSGAGGAAVAQYGGQYGSTFSSDAEGEDAFAGAGDSLGSVGNGSFVGAGDDLDVSGSARTTMQGNQTGGNDAFAGAGDSVAASSSQAFVGAGNGSGVGEGASDANVLGGLDNLAFAAYASTLGGYGNTANGEYDVVAGGNTGYANATLEFVAGYHATSTYSGSFVWGDYTSSKVALEDFEKNQFITRASGGTYLYSNEGHTSGVALTAGSGTWASLSDRHAKVDIVPVNDASVLAAVAALPIDAWRYKAEKGVRHIGPMAQDFYAAFGTGADDRHITSIDEDGVALAAIEALSVKVDRDNRRWESRRSGFEVRRRTADATLDARLANLESDVASLAKRSLPQSHPATTR